MQAEAKFLKRVDSLLDNLENCWHTNIQQLSIHGVHDRIACINGRFVSLEAKADEDTKPSKSEPLQRYNREKIIEAGGYCEFIYPQNWNDVANDLIDMNKPVYPDVKVKALNDHITTLKGIILILQEQVRGLT